MIGFGSVTLDFARLGLVRVIYSMNASYLIRIIILRPIVAAPNCPRPIVSRPIVGEPIFEGKGTALSMQVTFLGNYILTL